MIMLVVNMIFPSTRGLLFVFCPAASTTKDDMMAGLYQSRCLDRPGKTCGTREKTCQGLGEDCLTTIQLRTSRSDSKLK